MLLPRPTTRTFPDRVPFYTQPINEVDCQVLKKDACRLCYSTYMCLFYNSYIDKHPIEVIKGRKTLQDTLSIYILPVTYEIGRYLIQYKGHRWYYCPVVTPLRFSWRI